MTGPEASALARLAQAISSAGRPFDLWTDIRALADWAARGEAEALWADEAALDRGVLFYAPSPKETDFFGYGCVRLAGPYLPPEAQEEREAVAARLAVMAAARARERGDRLLTLKTGLDPAVLRGLVSGGFVLGEISAVLELDLTQPIGPPAGPPPGFTWLERSLAAEQGLVESLGDIFYDGHLRHDPKPGPAMAGRLWRLTAKEELAGAAEEAVILWDSSLGRGAGLATARLSTSGQPGRAAAALSILALAEPYRGRGLGRGLLEELIRRLAGLAGRLRAETAAYNLPALALYQALGFRPSPPLAALHLHPEHQAIIV